MAPSYTAGDPCQRWTLYEDRSLRASLLTATVAAVGRYQYEMEDAGLEDFDLPGRDQVGGAG